MLANRLEPYLKIASLCLAALIVLQLAQFGRANDPLQDLPIVSPPPPTTNHASSKPAAGSPLPPPVASLISRINESETLGPMQRPQPIQLLGIAGPEAFLQDPNGQAGFAREGEVFNGIEVLRIGINRALILHEGVEKELTVFSGIGSESLIKKDKQ